jgi:GntR family transcriptional regulator
VLFDVRLQPRKLPIYEQIVTQVIFGVASGALKVGQMVPSVRELGQRLVVHPNTVARAFQDLERLGVLAARRGKGMEVTPAAPQLCRCRRRQIVRGRIREALHEAVSSDLVAEEIRRLVDEELARANGRGSASPRTRERQTQAARAAP